MWYFFQSYCSYCWQETFLRSKYSRSEEAKKSLLPLLQTPNSMHQIKFLNLIMRSYIFMTRSAKATTPLFLAKFPTELREVSVGRSALHPRVGIDGNVKIETQLGIFKLLLLLSLMLKTSSMYWSYWITGTSPHHYFLSAPNVSLWLP